MSPASQSPISRRNFHGLVLSAAATSLAAGPRASTAQAAAPPMKYADCHVHLTQGWSSRPYLTRESLLSWMDEHNVGQAVVLPLVSPEAWYYPISTDWVLEQTRPCRDRLVPFCDFDPRATYLSEKELMYALEAYLKAGARGLGEHKCGVPIDDPNNLKIFRACSRFKLPVLLHMDTIRNTDEPGLPGLERALQAAPEANFIGHATTFWSSISGGLAPADLRGYPKTPVKPGGALDRLMDKYPNLYGDLSAGSGLNALRRDPDFGRAFVERRADRLLFGTDYLAEGQQVDQFAFLDQLDLPADVQEKVFRDNLQKLLR